MDMVIIICAKYLIVVPVIVLSIYFLQGTLIERKRIFWLTLVTLPVAYCIAKLGSHFYFDPRPFVQNNFIPLLPHAPDNGFPSDHTLLASAVASILYGFNKKQGAILMAVSFLIGFGRVLAGVHHTVDILGSLLISIFAAYIAHAFLLKYSKMYKNTQQ